MFKVEHGCADHSPMPKPATGGGASHRDMKAKDAALRPLKTASKEVLRTG
jgi:hypothetical protein